MKLKPLKVEHLYDSKTKSSVDLMLDRDEKVFFAIVEHEKISAPSIDALREKVKKAFARQAPVNWERVIELSVSEGHATWRGTGGDHVEQHEAEISISFKRFEIGTTSAGINLMRPCREDEHEHWHASIEANPLYHSSTDYERDSKDARRIPYTDAVWAALQSVKETIDLAYAKLEPLFDPKDKGQKLLALTGVKLLPASTEVIDPAVPWKDAAKIMQSYAPGAAQAEPVTRSKKGSRR